jgi:VanZ family protein
LCKLNEYLDNVYFCGKKTVMTRYFIYAAALYTLFVIYGSLVPLHFKGMPLSDALSQFKNIRYLNLGIGSLADWVANILLMIPLAFLWFSLLTKNAKLPAKIFWFILIWTACFLLALAIEFTQLFFPPRTVSINDIVAESLGAFIGCITGWVLGPRLIAWFQQWHQETGAGSWGRYLQIYLLGLFLYAVLPLDLTLSPIELYHKWHEGRIILLPFGNLKAGLVENIYQWLSEAVLWLPVPFLWRRTHRLNRFQLYQRIFLASLAIELFQLFVYSRVTDVSDIFLALLGGGIGIQLSAYLGDISPAKPTQIRFQLLLNQSFFLGILFYSIWGVLLMIVFWYPFNFDTDAAFVSEQIRSFFQVPFYAYYYGTEFRAITEVFHKIFLFMPVGIALALISRRYRFNTFSRFASYSWIALTALFIESGQILLPRKNADLTDWMLEFMGGAIGYVIGKQVLMNQIPPKSSPEFYRPSIAADGLHDRIPREIPANAGYQAGHYKHSPILDYRLDKRARLGIMLAIAISMLTLALRLVSELPLIPYNIRELISGEYHWLRPFGLSLTLFWCMGFPVWFLARILTGKRQNPGHCFTGLGLHSLVAWALIRLSAPLESIHDIVGSPVLTHIPAELELFLRVMAFFGIFSLLLFGAVMVTYSLLGYHHGLFNYYVTGFVAAVMLLPVYYWGVVLEAATDNIIELLPDEGRSGWVTLTALYVFLFAFIGSACSALLALKQWRKLMWLMLAGFISYPLGYWLIQCGTEQFIMKYGVVFSALQFLFSADRNHYAVEEGLKLRFYFAHTALIAMVIIAQLPQWPAIDKPQKIKIRRRKSVQTDLA